MFFSLLTGFYYSNKMPPKTNNRNNRNVVFKCSKEDSKVNTGWSDLIHSPQECFGCKMCFNLVQAAPFFRYHPKQCFGKCSSFRNWLSLGIHVKFHGGMYIYTLRIHDSQEKGIGWSHSERCCSSKITEKGIGSWESSQGFLAFFPIDMKPFLDVHSCRRSEIHSTQQVKLTRPWFWHNLPFSNIHNIFFKHNIIHLGFDMLN